MKKSGNAGGSSAKHAPRRKHAGTRKHAPKSTAKPAGHGTAPVHVVAKHPKPAKPRGLSAGVALCPAEAVAMAARLAGREIGEPDVLEIYRRCADGPTGGFTIAAALAAGIAGLHPEFGAVPLSSPSVLGIARGVGRGAASGTAALILGVDLPGAHAVTVGADGTWWSWGEPFDPAGWPGLVVEEAWQVMFA